MTRSEVQIGAMDFFGNGGGLKVKDFLHFIFAYRKDGRDGEGDEVGEEEAPTDCDSCELDALVDVLLHERHTGNYFQHFLQLSNIGKSETNIWLHCYNFWNAVQG